MSGNDKRKNLKSISYVILKAKQKLNSNDDQKRKEISSVRQEKE